MATSTHRAAKRALELIEAVAESDDALSLSELAQRANVPKSTAHALVHTLASEGFLERDGDGSEYILGPRLLRLLGRLPGRMKLPRIARPTMELLVDDVGETALLGVRRNASIIYVAQIEAPAYVRYAAPLGEPRPLYCTSIGKVLMACMDPGDLRALLAAEPPQSYTTHTKTSIDEILAEVQMIEEQRYAVNRGESIDGVMGIAVPVRSGGGPHAPVIAGLAAVGPADRVAPKLIECRERLLAAADQISLAIKQP